MTTTAAVVEIQCQVCGTTFEASRYEAEVRGRKFCSIGCRSEGRRIPLPPRDELESLYNSGMSTARLAAHYQVSKGAISNWLNQMGIEARPISEQLRMSAGRRRPRSRHGRRKALGGLYVRSSWECNWALVLNWMVSRGGVARWEYEPDTYTFPVSRGNRTYTPDFKVYRPDGSWEYQEVKGYMDAASRTKLKRMAKYYPDIKVRLIDEKIYRQFEASLAHQLEGWE